MTTTTHRNPPRIAYLSWGNIKHLPPAKKSLIRILNLPFIKLAPYKKPGLTTGHKQKAISLNIANPYLYYSEV